MTSTIENDVFTFFGIKSRDELEAAIIKYIEDNYDADDDVWEYEWHECECCGSYADIVVYLPNNIRVRTDGHFGEGISIATYTTM